MEACFTIPRSDSEQGAPSQLVADDEANDAEHGYTAIDELCIRGEHGEATPVLATLPRHTLQVET